MLDLMRKICPLSRVFVSPDYAKALELINERVPLEIVEIPSDTNINGWTVPPSWRVIAASISRDGKVMYDGTVHPLRVIALSTGFEGAVSREELREHLHYDPRHEDHVPFHFRQQYRPWSRDWGFCVPKSFYDALEPGTYEVELRVETQSEPMLIGRHRIQGELDDTFLLVAHLDHPGMANDDLAGVIAGLMIVEELSRRKNRFSYELLLVQEIVGSELYLSTLEPGHKARYREGLFLEMLGVDVLLALQYSFTGKATIDVAMKRALADLEIKYRDGAFRQVVGNDELNYEIHGIPMASLSRFPYPEYHSDLDNMDIIQEESLRESVRIVLRALEYVDCNPMVYKTFEGTPCLSSPQYDLYVDTGQPAMGSMVTGELRRLRLLSFCIPLVLASGGKTIFEMAEEFDLPIPTVYGYLRKWVDKGLLRFESPFAASSPSSV